MFISIYLSRNVVAITQSASPLGKLGIEAALEAAADPSIAPKPKIFDEFALTDRVGLVSGGNRGLGLEMALACCEAGARVVYCFDLPEKPSDEWIASRDYVVKLGNNSRLEYLSANVTDQQALWKRAEEIGDKEEEWTFASHTDCLEYPAQDYREVLDVNTNGVLFTAQAAGRQMSRFGRGGSIILIASMSGSITNRGHAWVSYNSSKAAVLQMARSMACELGEKKIRVNSLSPGHIYTSMTAAYLDKQPHLFDVWSGMNPLGRLGRPDELRGVVTWLASDASTFCTGSDIIVSGGHHSW
ncbi:uncharacterized protein BJ212DRAFT_1565134 [Suillus subaureus]|uniref:Sorbose reductase sou1 n=1 Tax=Suillus subaureus TaxID=48587 RepID=A0A9P7EPE5_9AGAM|nr:uncharacterized protein BJ212DRAFT_1565134 [Suillus subaureus]KAG1826763.1 hypothetical protein BJ212DRAFT_1565134 [Suillus subaureus]